MNVVKRKKPGPKPKGQVKLKCSSDFAYAIGLIVTDGCLLKNNRHLNLTTKDIEQAENFKRCLGLTVKLSKKKSGYTGKKNYYQVQFGDVLFHQFLRGIGITPNKTKTIAEVNVPRKYLFDFLRGHLDGDGTFYSYFDKRWKNSFMYYTVFISASEQHIDWIRRVIETTLRIRGHVCKDGNKTIFQLK